MNWGSNLTSLGTTTLKGKQVTFGIKDIDRLKHLCVLGRAGSGRANFISHLAFQDIERGLGTVILDAKGDVSQFMLERFGKEMEDRLVYLEPAEAEYPYSWNAFDDVRTLPHEEQEQALSALITSVYQLESDVLSVPAARAFLHKKDATLVMFYHLVFDEDVRKDVFGEDTPELKDFEALVAEHTAVVDMVEEHGRYVAKDTLVRNLVGQVESKFSFSDLPKGRVVIVNLEKIRMFPTRMAPLVRLFTFAGRMAGTREHPVAVYLHDALRHLGAPDVEHTFNDASVACTVSDTALQERDRERREQAIAQCGSVISFAAHTLDRPLIERAFYPYVEPEEIEYLEAGEFVAALTVDGVRTCPFFGVSLKTSRQRTSSYQDLVALSRSRYTTGRTQVDELFKTDDDDKRGPKKPPGFQDAFKAMFDKRAKAASVKENSSEKKTEETKGASAVSKSQVNHVPERARELSEDMLKSMVYVPAVS